VQFFILIFYNFFYKGVLPEGKEVKVSKWKERYTDTYGWRRSFIVIRGYKTRKSLSDREIVDDQIGDRSPSMRKNERAFLKENPNP
jgi:hypothetical protein